MSSTSNLSSDITALIQQYYERKSLKERVFKNGLIGTAKRADIPQRNSSVARFHRWQKFALAETVTEGVEPVTPITADVDEVVVQMKILASKIQIPTEGDIIRIDSLIKESYPKFTEQLERSANRELITSIANGASVGSSSFNGFVKRYANGKASFGDLTAGDSLRSKDIQEAVGYLMQIGAPGPYLCMLNPWTYMDLMAGDAEFRDLIKNQGLKILQTGELDMWAGAKMGMQDEPWRESLSGAEGTYAGTGNVLTTYVYSKEAIGITQLLGKTGLTPKFKVQDITATGSLMTIGWRTWFGTVVLNSVWGVQLKSVGLNTSVSSVS